MTERHVRLCQRPWNGKACTCTTSPFPRQAANQFQTGGKGEEEALPSSFTSVFSAACPTPQASTPLPPELGAGVLSLSAAEASAAESFCHINIQGACAEPQGKTPVFPDVCSAAISKVKTDSSQKKISMACEILSNVCSMHGPPFHYFCIHSALSELLPCLLLTVVSMVCLLSCRSPVLLPLPHNH